MNKENFGFIGGISVGCVLILIAVIMASCTVKIPVGYNGVIYSMSNGIKEDTLEEGWHIISPTEHVKLFTISNEQFLLTKDEREGSETDESFKVATSDNASISISFQMSYKYSPEKIVNAYKSFRMGGEQIVNSRVRTVLKSKISEITTNYSLMDLYSGDRAAINERITKYLDDEFEDKYGITVLDASIIDVHPDKKLQQAIDNRVEAQQKADQAKAEQKTAEVEAETEMIKAKNEKEIKILEAEAEAEANRKISESITPELIKMEEAKARLKHGWVTVQGADSVVTKE